jgi:DNA-binding XRE family transcriptional regulator
MAAKKIEDSQELTQAQRLEYLNRSLENLRLTLTEYFQDIRFNYIESNQKSDRLQNPPESQITIDKLSLTNINLEQELTDRLQEIITDNILQIERNLDNYKTSDELEANIYKIHERVEIQINDLIGVHYPQLKNKIYQPLKFEPQLFANNKHQVLPATLPMKTSTLCQLRDDFWQQDGSNGVAYYRQESKTNSKNYIEHYISSSEDIQILPWDSARQIIDKFGFNTVLLQLLFAAHAVKCARPWESQFFLSGTDIIRELGWDKRTDVSLATKLLELANTAFALDCLLIKAVWEDPRSKKGKTRVAIDTSRMWNVRVKLIGQMDLSGNVESPDELYLTVRPGLWTQEFVNGNCTTQDALYQFGYLAQDVLKMNPYQNELALRLAIHLTLDSHVDRATEYRVGDLLEIALPKYKSDLASNDKDRKYKLKQHWDRALVKLMELGWIVEFDDETYPQEIRPNSETKKNQRGYMEKLIAAKIYIRSMLPHKADLSCRLLDRSAPDLPPLLIESRPSSKLKTFKSAPTKAIIPNLDLKAARSAKGWTQRELAAELEVSQSLVAQWERGNRSIDEKNLKKLQVKLDL